MKYDVSLVFSCWLSQYLCVLILVEQYQQVCGLGLHCCIVRHKLACWVRADMKSWRLSAAFHCFVFRNRDSNFTNKIFLYLSNLCQGTQVKCGSTACVINQGIMSVCSDIFQLFLFLFLLVNWEVPKPSLLQFRLNICFLFDPRTPINSDMVELGQCSCLGTWNLILKLK